MTPGEQDNERKQIIDGGGINWKLFLEDGNKNQGLL